MSRLTRCALRAAQRRALLLGEQQRDQRADHRTHGDRREKHLPHAHQS